MRGDVDPIEALRALARAIQLWRIVLAGVGLVTGILMYWRMVLDSAALRADGINGEIALLYEGWRRDAALLITTAGLLMIVGIVTPATVTIDSLALGLVSSLTAWVGVQRMRDRRRGELAAAKRQQRTKESA